MPPNIEPLRIHPAKSDVPSGRSSPEHRAPGSRTDLPEAVSGQA